MPDNPFGFEEDGDFATPPPAQSGKGPFDHIEPEEVNPFEVLEPDETEASEQTPPAEPAPPGEELIPPTAREQQQPPAEELPPASEGQQPGETEQQWVSRYVGEGKKYADDRGLEQGYENALAMQERTAADLAATRGRAQQLEQLLRQAAELQKTQAPREPQPLDPRLIAMAEQAGWDRDQLALAQGIAEQQAATRVEEMQRTMLANGQQAAAQAEAQASAARDQAQFEAFRAAHVEDYSSPELAVAALRETWDALDVYADDPLPITARNLEIAHEASRDPELLSVLSAMPDFVDTEQGMTLARRLAHEGTPAPPAAPRGGTPGARLPHVEGGGRGPAPDQQAADNEWPVLTLEKQNRAKTSPLGI